MRATFFNAGSSLSIGVFFSLMIIGLVIVIGYLMLSINVYLETHVFNRFELGYGLIGPTEARLALIVRGADEVAGYRARGFSFLGIGADIGLVANGARSQLAAARAPLAEPHAIPKAILSDTRDQRSFNRYEVYFDGSVVSHTVHFADGTKKTLGIMMPGDYEFGTEAAEIMEMLGGQMDVLLPGETQWKTFKAGESYQVPANSKFDIRCTEPYHYICHFA